MVEGGRRKAARMSRPVREWKLQAAAVVALRQHPDYGRRFLIAGDQNAGKRGPQAMMIAKVTGMEPGEPDLRVYADGGRLLLIEYKAAKGRLSKEQRQRHADMGRLGYEVATIKAATEAQCAATTLDVVNAWLAA